MQSKKIVILSLSALTLAAFFKFTMDEPSSSIESPVATVSIPSQSGITQFNTNSVPVFEAKPAVMTPDEVFISEGVKQQMADIAASFEENMRYPTYSTPLHKSDWTQLNPRAFVPKAMPLAFDESISAELVLDHYIAHTQDDLDVSLNISGTSEDRYGDALAVDHITLSIKGQGKEQAVGHMTLADDFKEGVSTYIGVVSSNSLGRFQTGEVLLSADIQFSNHEQARVSAGVKLADNVATLTDIDSPYIDGANLIIPARFDVKERGFYRLQANLFDQEGLEPISHLNASFMLEGSNAKGEIKVHASTLRAKGDAGPYLLKDIDLTRGPAKPGDKTAYGSASASSFKISGFDLDAYSKEEYLDPKAQQRLEFLQKMAGIN